MNKEVKKNELDLMNLLSSWLKYWYIFVVCAGLSVGLGVLYFKIKIPELNILSKVSMRSDELSGGGISQSSIMSSLGLGRSAGYNVEDEANKMASQGSIKEVVSQLNLQNKYTLIEYLGIIKTDFYETSPIKISYEAQISDTLSAFLFFTLSVENDKIGISLKANKDQIAQYTISSLPGSIQTPYGQFAFDKTDFYAEQVKPFKMRIQVNNIDFQAQVTRSILLVEFEKKSSALINLSYIDTDPVRAKDILRVSTEIVNKEYAEDKSLVGSKTLAFLSQRIETVKQELDLVDQEIKDFKTTNKLTILEADATAFLEQSAKLGGMSLIAQTQVKIFEDADKFISDPANEYELIPYFMTESDAVSDAITSYNEELMRRKRLQNSANNNTTSDNSLLAEYDKQLQEARKNVLKTLKNIKYGLQITAKDLQRKDDEFTARIVSVPSIEEGYVALQRKQKVAQTIYIFLLEKREESEVKAVAVMPRLKVIDAPYALANPVSPGIMKVVLIAISLGGILLPLSIIYSLPFLQRVFRRKRHDK
ncbi:hypothetical protein AwDysgo_06290 [Bacteroidales bacterium]|nr:hypothetical protein AwDysgo_06290 [Bacteroidales bacterium]